MGLKFFKLRKKNTRDDEKQISDEWRSENNYVINPKRKFIKTRFSFDSDCSKKLSFVRGDVMEVLREDRERLFALNVTTQAKGYIPKNYFVQFESFDEYDWYHGNIDRKEAKKRLLNQRPGTFMVRDSRTYIGLYAISLVNKDYEVIHYLIERMYNGDYYIKSKHVAKDLNSLVEHCKANLTLCCFLTEPCKISMPARNDLSGSTRDKCEIDRQLIELRELALEILGKFGKVDDGNSNKNNNNIKNKNGSDSGVLDVVLNQVFA